MEQNTGSQDYKILLGRICAAMGTAGKKNTIDKFGKGVANLEHTWEAYHFIAFIEEIFKFDHKGLMSDFESLVFKLGLGEYVQGFRKKPSEKGFTEVKARLLFKGVAKIRSIKDHNFTERDLLLEFLIFCQKPFITKDGEKPRAMSIFYGEEIDSATEIKKNDPELIEKAQARLSEEIESLRKLSKHGIYRTKDKKKWLNPCNYDALKLIGREDEWERLDEFVKDGGPFKIWAISGPSGSGKTRLACQWAYFSEALNGWDRQVLHKENRTNLEKWAKAPDRSTLIIIDYLYGFEDAVLKLMSLGLGSTTSKIRLLLIDHIFSEPLHSDKRWGFSGDGLSLDRNEEYFFDLKPLNLEKTDNQKIIIKSIIANRTDIGIKSQKIEEAHKYLSETQGAYHPLFAALVADAINSGKDFTVWNRRELINYYLSGERLPWKIGTDEGKWASHFIAVATARRGVAYEDLFEAANNCVSAPEHYGNVQEICQTVITDNDEITLKPFEPDILGESFFLKFLQNLKKSPKYKTEFQQVFTAGNVDTQTEDVISFTDFIRRLTRNLLNDDQSQEETQELWNTLFDFMCPSQFENAEPMRWAMTAGIIDIADEVKGKFPENKLIALLNQVDSSVFYHIDNSILLKDAVLYAMYKFELTSKLTKTTPKFPEEMFALFDRYIASNIYEFTPLMYASYYGLNETVNALIVYGVDIELAFADGQNALMAASLGGQTEVIKQLLNAEVNIHTIDNENRTALIWASINGHIDVIKLLLEKGAKIDATDKEGFTPLIWASIKGHAEVVKLLLDKGANIHSTDNEGRTAFFWASASGYIDVVKLLLEKGAKIDATDIKGTTALFWASATGRAEVVKLLLEKGANIHSTDIEGATALFWASASGYVEVVKLLLEKGAKIDAASNKGATALFWACDKGHIEVVKLLLDKGTNIHTVNNEGHPTLFYTSAQGHTEVVKLLLDRKVDIDVVDYMGNTALHWASLYNRIEVVRLLLKQKARIDTVNNSGQTALSIVAIKGYEEIITLLIEYGAKNFNILLHRYPSGMIIN